jgi:hypothetical protein
MQHLGERVKVIPRDAIERERLAEFVSNIHAAVGMDIPFDAEVSLEVKNNPAYKILQFGVRQNFNWAKQGWFEGGSYEHRYGQWQKANERLNSIYGVDYDGQGTIDVWDALLEIPHDRLFLFIMTMMGIFVSSFIIRAKMKQDADCWQKNPEAVIREIWEGNPFFAGIDDPGIASLREIIDGLLGKGLTEEQLTEMSNLRDSLEDDQKVLLEAVLMVAADRPDWEGEIGNRWAAFIPWWGATLMRLRPNFKARQDFNARIAAMVKAFDPARPVRELHDGLKALFQEYGLFSTEVVEVKSEGLPGLDVFSEALKQAFFEEGSAAPPRDTDRSRGPNGTYMPRVGRSAEYMESRPYVEGDDVRNIDWNTTARTGVAMIKVRHEQAEHPAGLLIDLTGITLDNMSEWLTQCVDTVKALDKGRNNQYLQSLTFVMPDGKPLAMNKGLSGAPMSFATLRAMMVPRIIAAYKSALEHHSGQPVPGALETLVGMKFYDPVKGAAYATRAGVVLKERLTSRKAKDALRAATAVRTNGTLYVIGFTHEGLKALRQAMPTRKIYFYKDHEAVRVSAKDFAQGHDRVGGIDLRSSASLTKVAGVASARAFAVAPPFLSAEAGYRPVIAAIESVGEISEFVEGRS